MASRRLWVAMSGGVDSSVAAAIALSQGWDVVGVTLDLGRGGPDAGAILAARAICDRLHVGHRVIDVSAEFDLKVVDYTAAEYAAGRTPNPCVVCNQRIKFGTLYDAAIAEHAHLATGHYARVAETVAGLALAAARDVAKDQTYFLYRLDSETLEHVLFPLGDLTKDAVRERARSLGFAGVHTDESQDACFVGPGGYAALVTERRPDACVPGPVLNAAGDVLGKHRGVCRYTVGQRRGLGIASDEPMYVTRIDASANAIVVGPADDLLVSRVVASDTVWREAGLEACVDVKCRYNSPPTPALVRRDGDILVAELERPIAGVAPGQSLVCYNSGVVVGGGTIEEAS